LFFIFARANRFGVLNPKLKINEIAYSGINSKLIITKNLDADEGVSKSIVGLNKN